MKYFLKPGDFIVHRNETASPLARRKVLGLDAERPSHLVLETHAGSEIAVWIDTIELEYLYVYPRDFSEPTISVTNEFAVFREMAVYVPPQSPKPAGVNIYDELVICGFRVMLMAFQPGTLTPGSPLFAEAKFEMLPPLETPAEENLPAPSEFTEDQLNLLRRIVALQGTTKQVGGNHYDLPIHPLTFCQLNELPFCESNAIKYVARHAEQETKADGLKSLRKAIDYIRRIMADSYGVTE